jgi:hypothetical protein
MGDSGLLMYLAGALSACGAGAAELEIGELGRRGVGQGAPAEGDDAAEDVDDREHQAVAEAIVVARAGAAGDEQADALADDGGDALLLEEGGEAVPAEGGVADAEGLEGVGDAGGLAHLIVALARVGEGQGAARELGAGVVGEGVRRGDEATLEEGRGEVVDRVEVVLGAAGGGGLASLHVGERLLDGDARALGEHAHRLGEGAALDLHDEVDGAAALLAAEAVEEAALGVDVEARRLLLVEGAEAGERAAATRELDRLADEGDEVGALLDLRSMVSCAITAGGILQFRGDPSETNAFVAMQERCREAPIPRGLPAPPLGGYEPRVAKIRGMAFLGAGATRQARAGARGARAGDPRRRARGPSHLLAADQRAVAPALRRVRRFCSSAWTATWGAVTWNIAA